LRHPVHERGAQLFADSNASFESACAIGYSWVIGPLFMLNAANYVESSGVPLVHQLGDE